MKYLFICYKACSSCAKAKRYLINNNIEFDEREISKDIPSEDEIKDYLNKSNYSLKDFFNTRGASFKKLNLKEDFDKYSEEELIKFLSEDGMLLKRPILVSNDNVILGFSEKLYGDL